MFTCKKASTSAARRRVLFDVLLAGVLGGTTLITAAQET